MWSYKYATQQGFTVVSHAPTRAMYIGQQPSLAASGDFVLSTDGKRQVHEHTRDQLLHVLFCSAGARCVPDSSLHASLHVCRYARTYR